MYNRHILITERNADGKQVSENISVYTQEEMPELFSPHERIWLNEGKMVERETKFGKTVYVDLLSAYKSA